MIVLGGFRIVILLLGVQITLHSQLEPQQQEHPR